MDESGSENSSGQSFLMLRGVQLSALAVGNKASSSGKLQLQVLDEQIIEQTMTLRYTHVPRIPTPKRRA